VVFGALLVIPYFGLRAIASKFDKGERKRDNQVILSPKCRR